VHGLTKTTVKVSITTPKKKEKGRGGEKKGVTGWLQLCGKNKAHLRKGTGAEEGKISKKGVLLCGRGKEGPRKPSHKGSKTR